MPVYSKNCGVVGEVYPIAEEDFVVFIKKQLNAIKGTPKYNQLQQKLKDGVYEKVDRPTPVSNLSVTQTPKTFTVDPSIVLSEPIVNTKGQVIAPAGTTVNPLSKITLHSVLLFYNADDPAQVAWATEKLKQFNHAKLILVGGSVHSQIENFKQPVYFDQEGRLVSYFKITQSACDGTTKKNCCWKSVRKKPNDKVS
ncbi:MAG: type-F conjugative transfer system protein TraW [Gammaproteobacteria bacterium]|nr:type-F conjugative transfer system protein TraW [Gammaproteobacteria bacterium]